MKNVVLFPLFFLAAMFWTACSPQAPKEVGVGDAENGTSVALSAGDTLVITLEGNPTTGYLWEADAVNADMLEAYGEGEFKPKNKDLMGSPGKQTLSFKVLKPGETTLKLVYHRPWEKDVPPEKTYEITVKVK